MKTKITNKMELEVLNRKELSNYLNNEIKELMNEKIFKYNEVSSFRYYDKDELNDHFECLKKKEQRFILGQTIVLEKMVKLFDIKINSRAYNFLRYYNGKVK